MKFVPATLAILVSCASLTHGGLVGHWRLNGNADDSGGTHNGVFVDTEAYAAGPIGQAASFDGATLIDLGDSTMPIGAYTKSAWVYRTADAANNILSGATAHAFWCSNGSGNAGKLAAGHGGQWYTVQSDAAVPINTWMHVAVTYDPTLNGGTLALYSNGVPVGGTNGVATGVAPQADAAAHIGGYGTANFFSGRIDDVGLWNEALSDSEILAIYNAGLASNDIATLWLTAPPVTLADMPKPMQVYPRALPGNTATIPVSGTVNTNGYDEAVLTVYREDVPFLVNTQALVYAGSVAPFSFSPVVTAELANYDFELSIVQGTNTVSMQRVNDVTVGDIYIIQGQSNADANMFNGTANGNQHPFLRTFGMNSDNAATTTANTNWLMATGDGSRNKVGGVGQWGLRMGRLLIESQQIPVAILNGAHGGKPISFFQRNDANREDLSNNYGRLLYRARLAGVTNDVRAVLWYQGEAEGGNGVVHENGFILLYQDWKEDYPGIERVYVHQLRVGCGVTKASVDLRDRQRRLQDSFDDISVMSTTGINGHDGCHYAYETGYKLIGNHIAALVGRDLYGEPDLPNIEAPNIDTVMFADSSREEIVIYTRNATDQLVFDPGAKADWLIQGTTATVIEGTATNNRLTLTLSEPAQGATNVIYTGHQKSGPWVTNVLGVGLLTFSSGGFSSPTSPPAAPPTNVTGVAISSGRVRLSWGVVTNASSFAIRRDGAVVGTTGAMTFTDSGLTALTSYDYAVAAVNALGTSGWSSVVSVQTLEPEPVPETPTGLDAVARSSSSVALSWSPVSNALWYAVQRNGAVIDTLGGTNMIDTELAPETRYAYAVAAANDSGTSAWSSVIAVTTTSISVFANVPEATDYELVYTLEIPNEGNFRDANPVPYSLNRTAAITGYFDRVAYYLELDDTWVYVSMDAFTIRAEEIGLPHTPDNPVFFQTYVSNLHVLASADANVTTGEVAVGNLEFWPNNYGQANEVGVPGAAADAYDFGDDRTESTNPGYGSFQVHNTGAGHTLFAYNRWGNTGNSDIGIGNQATGSPDWTFAQNAATHAIKNLYMLVRPAEAPVPDPPADVTAGNVSVYSADLNWSASVGATGYVIRINGEPVGAFASAPARLTNLAPQAVQQVEIAAVGFSGVSAPTTAVFTTEVARVYSDVPEALDYEVIHELDIENDANYRNATLPAYARDISAEVTQAFDRVAYYLQLDGNWVFVSMDAFTTNAAHLAIPQNTLNVFFQQEVTNMNVTVSPGSPVTTGTGIQTGWIEFWPNNYSPANEAGVPDASDTVWDFGDDRAEETNPGYGCLQVHNYGAGEVLLAYNRWGTAGADCLGIGNNTVERTPDVIHTDWTFRDNAADYATKRLYVLARLGTDADGDGMTDAWERRELGGTHTDAGDDSDGDGADNGTEFVAGTGATDADDTPCIMIDASDGALSFNSISQRTYRVLFRTNLADGSWQALGTNIPGDGRTISVSDTNTVDAQRFYRLGIRR